MNNIIRERITYKEMEEIIKNYYSRNNVNVSVKISNLKDTDRFPGTIMTFIKVTFTSSICGIKTKAEQNLSMDDLKEILSIIFSESKVELLSLKDDSYISTKTVGYGLDEHTEQVIRNKSFLVTIKPTSQVLSRKLQ